MDYEIARTTEEIDNLLNDCAELDSRTNFRGMTYEQGIRAAIDWITGQTNDHPFE